MRFEITTRVKMATYTLHVTTLVLLAMVALISAAPIEGIQKGEELGDGEPKDLLKQSLQLLASSKKEGVVKRDINATACLEKLYVMAFTSGLGSADVNGNEQHEIEVRAAGDTRHVILPDIPGTEYQRNEGDLWELGLQNDFHFTATCIKLEDIEHIALEERSNDAWNIQSVITVFKSTDNQYQVASVDVNVFRWIDGDGNYPGNPAPHNDRHFELTLVI